MQIIFEDSKSAGLLEKTEGLLAEDCTLPVFSVSKETTAPFVAVGCLAFCLEACSDSGIVLFTPFVNEELPMDLVLVGIHQWIKEGVLFVKKNNIQHFDMKDIAMEGKEAMCDAVMAAAKDWKACCLLIDMDVVDSEEMPGGMTARELLYFVQRMKKLKNIVGAGIIGKNDDLAAKLLLELASLRGRE